MVVHEPLAVGGGLGQRLREVCRLRIEENEAAVGRDGGIAATVIACCSCGAADQKGRAADGVTQIHLSDAGRGVGHEVVRTRVERCVASIPGQDRFGIASGIGAGVPPGGAHGKETGLAGLPVVEVVLLAVSREATYEVGRFGVEGYITAVPGDKGIVAVAVARGTLRRAAHKGRLVQLTVPDIDVLFTVRYPRHEVRRLGGEDHVAAIFRKGGRTVGR
ncbi:MAG: hypothetical protein BWY06_02410 [Candidatus Latescibacteria bacterium ADurb.Bin168]|nr:MAG: hypothetical protein BWY06_02410 [Candidatus Latescibacteria bacterium ADurb.Bin168]